MIPCWILLLDPTLGDKIEEFKLAWIFPLIIAFVALFVNSLPKITLKWNHIVVVSICLGLRRARALSVSQIFLLCFSPFLASSYHIHSFM